MLSGYGRCSSPIGINVNLPKGVSKGDKEEGWLKTMVFFQKGNLGGEPERIYCPLSRAVEC
jgi:hypothetical protein